jgi:integrase/recombinase XerD
MPGPEPRLHLPYSQWPATDRLLWQQGFGQDDPFAQVRLSEASQARCMWAWRRFLAFLKTEEPEALDLHPGERLTAERVRLLAAELAKTNAPNSVATILQGLHAGARVMMPDRDWSWLRAIKDRVRASAPAPSRMGPVVTSSQLLELGLKLMDANRPELARRIGKSAAIAYRDGLMIALLAFHPLRPKNLTALEIGRHVIQEDERWFIVVPRTETKTRRHIEFDIPEMLIPYLKDYLEIVRPQMLPRGSCAALWVNFRGRPLSYVTICKVFVRLSGHLGFRIEPHDVRDAAATTWAIERPEQIGVSRDLLSHADLRTTERHYNRARGIEASRAYGRLIADIRRKKM